MTAKTNVNAAVAAAAVEVNDTHKSRLTLDASDAMDITQPMQRNTSKPENQAPLIGNEIHNDRKEICSKKRNLETLDNDDVESAASHNDEDHGHDSDDPRSIKPGRRPMAEEECDVDEGEDPKVKRKIQNRAAQRAFRERKDRYVKELEKKIKYVQDSHVYSTTRLFNENQQLRSIVYTLELEINALKGVPFDFTTNSDIPRMEKKCPSQSWLANIGPSIPLSVINSFPPTPLAPLRIHPSHPSNYQGNNSKASATSMPEEKNQKEPTEQQKLVALANFADKSKQMALRPSKIIKSSTASTKRTKKSHADTASQRFTFAITTPATLRADSNSDFARKNTQIEAVQLYPGHSHPANCMLDNNKQTDHMPYVTHSTHSTNITPVLSPHYISSVASSCSGNSCTSSPSGEEARDTMEHTSQPPAEDMGDDLLLFDHATDEVEEVGLNDILKHFFDPTGNLDLSMFNAQAPNDWEAPQ
ncbi:Mannan polymerase II complex anp1 subunit [Mucor velutinosus]|uniref:Mannan polymerase II complex anp1 subunit n=1 Tax=Mucor velutinosus TaxID=708070 RepID=A0AAN7DGP0_9FUNG|nr:Mannan polymerase II complex anp1 subunit [Mucor velutinosus]